MSQRNGLPDYIIGGSNANPWEQIDAGATPEMPSHQRDAMVQDQRRSRGLDPYTGMARHPGAYIPTDWGQVGRSVGTLIKVLCWTALVLLVLGGIAWTAKESLLYFAHADDAAMRDDPVHGGSARALVAKLFPGETMSPASVYLTKTELAAPLDEHEVLHAIKVIHDLKPVVPWTDLSNPQLRHVMAVSYACQVDTACRLRAQSVLNGPSDQRMLNYAARFLERNARKGMESASRDLCNLPLLTGNTREIGILTPDYCSLSLKANSNSPVAREHAAKIEDPANYTWMKLMSWVETL